MKRSEVQKAVSFYDKLMRQVLREQGITSAHHDYEEMKEELRFKLVELLSEYDNWDLFRQVFRHDHLKKQLRVHCIMLLRRDDEELQEALLNDEGSHPDLKHQLKLTLLFMPLWCSFTKKERGFLLRLMATMENQQMSYRARQSYLDQVKADLMKLDGEVCTL